MNDVANHQPLPGGGTAQPGKYLVVTIGGESYGISVMKVRQIVRLLPVTPVANMPEHVRGVINLRGKIVPLVDLRRRFGLPAAPDHDRTCIVVTQVGQPPAPQRLYGVVVDGVEEVAKYAADDIEPPPDFGGAIDARYITGMAKSGPVVRTLIDLELMAADELAPVGAAASADRPSPDKPAAS